MSGTAFTILELAQAVKRDDGLHIRLSEAQIAHVLEIALKKRIAVYALGRHADIDLGNGHVLHCKVKKIIGPIHV